MSSNEYLVHHGVKGQKWGVRRYQNADGSLTDAGRRRSAKDEYRKEKKSIKQQSRSEHEAYRGRLRNDIALKKLSTGEAYRRVSNDYDLKYYQSKSKRMAAKSKMNAKLADNSTGLSKKYRSFKSQYEAQRSIDLANEAKKTQSLMTITDSVYKNRLSQGEKNVTSWLNVETMNSYYLHRANSSKLESAGKTAVERFLKYRYNIDASF